MVGFAYTALITAPKYLSAERALGDTGSFVGQASNLKNQVNGLNAKINAIKTQSSTLFDVASQNTRYEFFDVFPSTVPPGIALSEFNLDRDGSLSIQGVAQSADLVTVFTDNLIREKLMVSPKLRATYKSSGTGPGFRFELYGRAGQNQ
jgi:Tfp pilus assembly protein PilN